MKRLKIVAIAAAVSLVMTGCRNIEENSVHSDTSNNRATESVVIVNRPNGETTTMIEIEMPDPDPDACPLLGDGYGETGVVTLEQLSNLPANTPFCEIPEKIGAGRCRWYITDDDRALSLGSTDKNAVCPYSGEELYNSAIPLRYDGETPDGMIYGILGRDGGFFTHYDTYYTERITGDYIMTSDAEIIFEDGTPATKDDLKPEARVFVESDYVLECAPGRMHCTKIVILK